MCAIARPNQFNTKSGSLTTIPIPCKMKFCFFFQVHQEAQPKVIKCIAVFWVLINSMDWKVSKIQWYTLWLEMAYWLLNMDHNKPLFKFSTNFHVQNPLKRGLILAINWDSPCGYLSLGGGWVWNIWVVSFILVVFLSEPKRKPKFHFAWYGGSCQRAGFGVKKRKMLSISIHY